MSAAGRTAVLLLAAACAGGTPPAPTPAPSPGQASRPTIDPGRTEHPPETAIRYPSSGTGIDRYLLARRDSIAVSMPSGESQLQVRASTAYVSLTWTAADTGTSVSVVLDSLVADRDYPLPFAQIDSAHEARWSFLRTPTGGIVDLRGGPASLHGDQVRDQVALLFPPLPAGGARPGATWSDSAAMPSRVSAFEATEHAALAARAAPAPGPRGSLHLTVVRTRSASGEGTQFGQAITVRATGSDTLDIDLALDGRVQAATATRVTDLVVDLPAIGQSVPARQVSFLKASLLP